jgi:SAM-dependent methyltransferase
MSSDDADAPLAPGYLPVDAKLGLRPDRLRWNAKYADGFVPSFVPHRLAVRALSMELPDGPVADLACGPSGTALLAAANGRRVTAVDVAEVALGMLGEEATRRGLGHLITLVHADLATWRPEPRSYALVLCTGFWDSAVFAAAAKAVAPGGLLAWQAYTVAARDAHPSLRPEWCLASGQPASLLPPDFTLIDQRDRDLTRRMLATLTA